MPEVRSMASKRFAIANKITTTVSLNTTTDQTYAFTPNGYASGIFLVRVAANSSAAPKIYLDVAVDTTTYVQYATLHPDLTTSANNLVKQMTAATPLTQTMRVRLAHASTTTKCRFSVKAECYPR